MRLGRKLAEGFVVDREADRTAAEQPAPVIEPSVPVTAEPDVFAVAWPATARTEPARSGQRAED